MEEIKNKFKSKIILVMLLLIFATFVSSIVYASDDSFDLNLNANTNAIAPGYVLSIQLEVRNINVTEGEKGLSGFTAAISFDDNVFEYQGASSSGAWNFSYQNKKITAYREDGGILSYNNGSEVLENPTIGTIQLKVKDSAASGDTTIKLENIEGADGMHTYGANTNELSISITEKEPALSSIEVVTDPNKTKYEVGEKFDPTGLEVLAKYDDDSNTLITDYTACTYSPSRPLTEEDGVITISYTKNGITKETKVEIQVGSNKEDNTNGQQTDTKDNNGGTSGTATDTTAGTISGTSIGDKENTSQVKTTKDNSVANKILPRTGKIGIVLIITSVLIILGLSITKYTKYKDIK